VRKVLFNVFALLLAAGIAGAQDNFILNQYFQNGPVLNPAFTGADNFLNIQLTYNDQWSGLDEGPRTSLLSVGSQLGKPLPDFYKQYSLRISDPGLYDSLVRVVLPTAKKIRHGLGGYVSLDELAIYRHLQLMANYAIHIPVGKSAHLSIGASAGIGNERIDLAAIDLNNPDPDELYQNLLMQGGRSTAVQGDLGLALRTRVFYISYATQQLLVATLSSDEVLEQEALGHLVMAGVRLPLGTNIDLLPSGLFSMVAESSYWDVGLKARVKERTWAGLSYRSTQFVSLMGGLYFNNRFNFGYSYTVSTGGEQTIQNASHELILGIMLFKPDYKPPYLW
jgi:type IX secretion system PorP/SprF family membrane protein